ncbi:MAG: hypothetical protein HKN25_10685 [Pyrinomonadaceae bacterium]|nr:hypothetical protein [Pyrinomonadaceae bacterium]
MVNLGNGSGYSVNEVVEAARSVTGKEIKAVVAPRREGDPTSLIADAGKARELLNWAPNHPKIDEIIESAWNWLRGNPDGYK